MSPSASAQARPSNLQLAYRPVTATSSRHVPSQAPRKLPRPSHHRSRTRYEPPPHIQAATHARLTELLACLPRREPKLVPKKIQLMKDKLSPNYGYTIPEERGIRGVHLVPSEPLALFPDLHAGSKTWAQDPFCMALREVVRSTAVPSRMKRLESMMRRVRIDKACAEMEGDYSSTGAMPEFKHGGLSVRASAAERPTSGISPLLEMTGFLEIRREEEATKKRKDVDTEMNEEAGGEWEEEVDKGFDNMLMRFHSEVQSVEFMIALEQGFDGVREQEQEDAELADACSHQMSIDEEL